MIDVAEWKGAGSAKERQDRETNRSSRNYLTGVLRETAAFPDRLKAGVPKDWTLAHKTGASGSCSGVTAATNDVGILQAPDGGLLRWPCSSAAHVHLSRHGRR
ncbi:MAG TPA: serine hydrolase [Acidobacteriaceae bacterium]|nr:serine hydrolase [Acidobacteriaceae bacterium]